MLQQIIWFGIGYGVAKLADNTECVKKVKKAAGRVLDSVKEEFSRADEGFSRPDPGDSRESR